ncbi:MAG TPA: hypothetical protein VNK95_22885, partial [Caldilineaceae bacterium]|nr:hypothetical protein [Caldilineaceae bacterium]
ALPPFDSGALGPSVAALGRLRQLLDLLDRTLRLPSTPRAFMIYLAALILIFAGATLHVFLAAQILQARVELRQLQHELAKLEEQNGDLAWQIARETNLEHVLERIIAQGYMPASQREYHIIPAAPAIADAASPAAAPQPLAAAASTLDDLPAASARSPLAEWETFFRRQWRPAQPEPSAPPAPDLASALTGEDAAGEQWRHWWQETLDRGAAVVQAFNHP